MTTSTSVWQFTVASSSTCDTPQAFRLNWPPNGYAFDTFNTSVGLSWIPPSVDPDYYDVYFGTTTSPSLVTTLPANSSNYTVTVAPGQTYYWKVVGRKDCTTYLYTAGPRTFSTNPCNPLGTFSQVSPPDGQTLANSPNAVLTWNSSANAEYYTVYFGTDPNPPYLTAVLAPATSYQVPVSAGNTYYWRIKANIHCIADPLPTQTWSFDVAPACPGASVDGLPTTPTVGLGVPYMLSGTVTSDYDAITNVTLKITKPDGIVDQSVTAAPYTVTYSLGNLTIPSSVLNLVGSYAVEVWVNTSHCTTPQSALGIFTLTVVNTNPSCEAWGIFGNYQLTSTASPNGINIFAGKAYIARGGANPRLTILDLAAGTETGNVSFSSGLPTRCAVVGAKAFVSLSNLGSHGKLAVIDLTSNSIITSIDVGSDPFGVAIRGNKVYVANNVQWTNGDPATVRVLDATTYALLKTINVGVNPREIAINQTTGLAYVVNYTSKSVSVIDTNTDTVQATIPLSYSPWAIALAGNKAFVSAYVDGNNDVVFALDLVTNAVLATIPVGRTPYGIGATADNVYVSNLLSSLITVLDVATNAVVAIVPANGQPTDIEADPSSNRAYAVYSGDWVRLVKKGTPAPIISSFSPGSGTTGTSVVLTGTNFGCCYSVSFNGTGATSFTVTGTNSISVQVPAGATTGPITVITPGGTYTSAANFVVSSNVAPTEASPIGQPAIWTKSTGSAVHVNYTSGCNATDDTIYWGASSGSISSLSWVGQACHLGTNGAATFDPGTPSGGSFMYFVIVANDGTKEGSYGKNSSGQERPAASALGGCTYTQDLSGTCN
jgi:YVTN family beta-propeller protein